MKVLGLILMCFGLVLGAYSMTLDVLVSAPAQDLGYGVHIPAVTVANADKMAQRQNLLIFSGVLAVCGALLAGFGAMGQRGDAVVRIAAESPAEAQDVQPRERQGSGPVSMYICSSCRHTGQAYDDTTVCERCGSDLS